MDGARIRMLWSIATFLFAHYFAGISGGISTDQPALLAFKSHISFGSQNAFLHKNWSSESSVCSWMGVLCDPVTNRVIRLDLPHMGLNGSIPSEMGTLSFLLVVDISYNNFHGNVPDVFAELRRLKYLYLRGNSFSGAIPPSIFASLFNLRFLDLSRNMFSGGIPSSISNMSRLEGLVLEANALQGSIPGEVGDLRFLRVLDLESNQLTGPVPRSVFNLSRLRGLAFTWNKLSGSLPEDLGFNLPVLKGLHLSMNEFDGLIPASLGKCSLLSTISLSYNSFSGAIPREIGNLTLLKHFLVTQNNLRGTIPAEIGRLQQLESFLAHENLLSGSIPVSFFNISSLRNISCSFNDLSGNLPSNMGLGIPNAEHINLSFNNLSGAIPGTISNASKLITLCLTRNSFTGSIPQTLGNLRSLEILCLASNKLTIGSSSSELDIITSLTSCRNLTQLLIGKNPFNAVLPASVGNLSTHLNVLDLTACALSGVIPEEIGNLSSVFRLNLIRNGLTGFIPRTVDGLSVIQELHLYDNRIEGSLPDTICNLESLGRMDLRYNRISGPIPSCIGNITSLRYLHLDFNHLNSTLAPSIWRLKNLLIFSASSNSLSGFIPPEIGSLGAITYFDLSKNSFRGQVPTTLGSLKHLVSLCLAQNELEGPIPASFARVLSLEMLDLSHNKLTGEIPESLEALLYLKLFNVSFNRLSGKIPAGGPFKNFTGLSFMSNVALCGPSRFEVLPCPTMQSGRRRFRSIMYIFLGMFTMIVLISAYLAFLFMRSRMKKKGAAEKALSASLNHDGISYIELRRITNGFSEGNLIAVGSNSSVYEGILGDGTHAAIKVFNFKLRSSLENFDTECHLLSNLRHRNLTVFISSSATWDQKAGALVLEYMPNGSLDRWLYSHNYFLGMLQRLDIMIDIASALDYLHNHYHSPVVHCDVKPSNVLLDEDMVAHLGDFGIAKLLGARDGNVHTKTIGTLGYIAPEYGNEGAVSTKCDVYSYGIMLMETFTRRRPSDDMFTGDITLRSWIRGSIPNAVMEVADSHLVKEDKANLDAVSKCVSSVMEVALKCTATAPGVRMNIHDVLSVLQKLRHQFLVMISSGKS